MYAGYVSVCCRLLKQWPRCSPLLHGAAITGFFSCGKVWEVTSMDYLAGLHTHFDTHGYYPGVFGGFAAGGSAAGPDQGGWKDFAVAPVTWLPFEAAEAVRKVCACEGKRVLVGI